MFLPQSVKIRSLLNRFPSKDSLRLNQGAVYLATSRAMSSNEVGSGAGKGGGGGGRLVGQKEKTKSPFTDYIKSVFKSTLSKTKLDLKQAQQQVSNNISSLSSSVREAGGSLGKKGAAQEEMYFAKQNNAMKHKLKDHLKEEIKKHEDAIKASKELMKELEKDK